MYNFLYYAGLILMFGGIIGFFTLCYFIFKDYKKTDNLKDLFNKYKFYLFLPLGVFLLGFIFINSAYFLDETTIKYLEEKSLSVLWYHNLFIYLFGIIFVFSIFTFIYSLFVKLYFEKYPIRKKHINLVIFISLGVSILSFIIYSEGLAPYLQYPLCNAFYIGKEGVKFINVYKYGSAFTGGITIYFYAIFILFGALLVLYVSDYKLYKLYGYHDLVTNTFLVGFPFGIIGARIWYVVLDISAGGTSFTGENWVKIFDLSHGGLGIMGGAILGIIAGVSQVLIVKYAMKSPKYKNFSLLQGLDIIIPCILFAQAIGRLGNFFNNEVFGNYIDRSYFEFLPSVIKNNMYFQHGDVFGSEGLDYYLSEGVIQLPLFFIEFLTNLLGYFTLEYLFRHLLKKYHSDGTLLGGYLIWYGVTRAILEPMRSGYDYFQASEYTSYAMIIGGVSIVIFFIINNYVFKKNNLLWYKKKEEVTND